MSSIAGTAAPTDAAAAIVGARDWDKTSAHLDAEGWAKLDGLLDPAQCQEIAV